MKIFGTNPFDLLPGRVSLRRQPELLQCWLGRSEVIVSLRWFGVYPTVVFDLVVRGPSGFLGSGDGLFAYEGVEGAAVVCAGLEEEEAKYCPRVVSTGP